MIDTKKKPLLILGSSSPRRKEILNFFHLPFEQIKPLFDENSILFKGDPVNYALQIAEGKARQLNLNEKNKIIISADTIVYKNNKVFLKPESQEEAFNMLKELQGSWHSVFTAISIAYNEQIISDIEESKVLFNSLSDEKIKIFLNTQPYQDKAGSYFIQTAGSLLVNKIEGCFYNIMGLPVNLLYEMLKKFNVDLWDFLDA
jgi:septum formation protein